MFEHAYLVFCAFAYALGFVVFLLLARRFRQGLKEIFWVFGIATLFSLFGAKIFHTLFEAAGHVLPNGDIAEGVWDLIQADPWHWARLLSHGHVFYGALIGAAAGVLCLSLINRRIRLLLIADCLAPGVALGLAVGRIGCFLTGCCFGYALEPNILSLPFFPTQLFESAFAFICFMWLFLKSSRPHQEGEIFLSFIVSYSLFRFFIEFFRSDADRGLWLDDSLSTSQLISAVILLALALFYWIEIDRRVKPKLS